MRRLAALTALAAVTVLGLTASPASADAQGLGARLKKKAEEAAKKKVEERTEKRAGEAADKALNKAECAASDKACQEKAAAAGGDVTPAGGAAALRPGEGAWANYDFKPGERVIFAEDFTKDEVGDFPRRMEFKSGQIEIVEWNGARWLRSGSGGEVYINLPEALPERFTMEFDLAGSGNSMEITFHGRSGRATGYLWVHTSAAGIGGVGLGGEEIDARGELGVKTNERPVRISLMVDGAHAKLYADERRVFNAPKVNLGRSKRIYFSLNGWSADQPRMLANIRIAAGGKKLYDALTEKGRVATQGIYFDTGSDRIRPESTPTLKEIGLMLTEHSDLKLTIEGHTDNVGNAAANQDLSQRRAAAVKAYLIDKHAVEASRLQSAGFGDKKPATANTTPEGRQQNRRVELVKM
jgi:outer membrane protein OmpA-like peptidoglycan-associated protein